MGNTHTAPKYKEGLRQSEKVIRASKIIKIHRNATLPTYKSRQCYRTLIPTLLASLAKN